eukprot:TRINITY_DN21844_c0_g1_i1.p1 TRINITY_DN21844_c0_g1~~TRINITY_DN21844_c0_g1_i1.p1  ORF type:complete len:142 (+),score=20.35 TRINITY_DN21844_c0_g1_i1:53-478(+)
MSSSSRVVNQHEQMDAKKKKIWELATSPRKEIMMMMFMMWLAGSDLNIFPIMLVAQAIYSPVNSITVVNTTFSRVVDGIDHSTELQEEVTNAKLFYILHQVVFIAIGLVKCYYMGLVPTNSIDWIDHTPQVPSEIGSGFSV